MGRTRWIVDTALAVVVTATLTVVISARQGGTQQPDAVAYGWAAGLGVLMFARRSYPRAVLLVSALGLFAYYAAGYPAVGIAVPLAAALFSAAEAGRLRAAAVTAGVVLVVSFGFRLLHGQDVAFLLGYELATHVTLMAAAIALGDGARGRREQRARQRELDAARDREQRLAIARELHDSIGHQVSVISLHAEVARDAAAPGNPALTGALDRIREAAGTTMTELRATVTLLRSPVPVSVTRLAPVLDTARAAGFDVSAEVTVAPGEVPAAVDAAAYRIVQEAVTNVVRHAGASRVEVVVAAGGGRLRVTVRDDGPPGARPGRHGHGIAGMTERAAAVGGTLRAEHLPTGFVVEADLPLAAGA